LLNVEVTFLQAALSLFVQVFNSVTLAALTQRCISKKVWFSYLLQQYVLFWTFYCSK